MTSTVERDLVALTGQWEPMAVDARHGPPRALVDPDPGRGWIRRVLPLFAVRKAAVISSLVCAFAAMLAQVAVPRVTMAAIDATLARRSSGLMPYVWILLARAAARGLLTFVYRFHLYRVAYDVEYDLRVAMYEHLTRMSFSFFDRVQSGQLISRANSDIRSMQLFLTFAPLLVLNIVSFFVAFGLMLSVDVPLALVALAPLPFVYVVGVRMRDLTFPTSWLIQARTADTATIVEENLTGVRVVKSFAAEKAQIGVLAAAARRLQWASVRQIDVRARYAPIMEGLPRLGMAAVLLYGGILAIDGRVTIGTIVAFSAYVVMLQAPFRMLGFFMMMGQRAAASAGRIYEILDTPPEILDRPGAVDLLHPDGRVDYRDVTFGYAGAPPVLDHFDLHLEAGETVALVGRTGCGKSTVARLLTRFYDVDGGHVEIDGHDVRDLTLASVRAQVSMVLDEPFLFSASVRDNIAYGRPDAPFDQVVAAARAANATEFIDELPGGYDTPVGERGYTLSGGQRQRIAIARTLLVNPRVLILDDATSAVDVHVEEEIHGALRGLMHGRTTLIIAHRLSTIGLAERVVLLERGHIVADGTHAHLMATEPRYAEVLAHIEADEAAKGRAPAAATSVSAARGDVVRGPA
jgi:ATP-binding cassette subfamily B protein